MSELQSAYVGKCRKDRKIKNQFLRENDTKIEEVTSEAEGDHSDDQDDKGSVVSSTPSIWGSRRGKQDTDNELESEAEGDLSSTYDQQILSALKSKRKEADSIKFPQINDAQKFRWWRLQFKKKVAGASCTPTRAFHWINEIEESKSSES